MKKKVYYLMCLLMVHFTGISQINENFGSDKPYLVILSMDGFRWDYPEKASTPNLDYIEKIGVRANASVPCFPTKTFPNHYSMATGLYPDHHGIVHNSFYAPDIDKYYSISNMKAVTDSAFYFGEPIWVTAEKQGVKSASYFWVGSEAPHKNIFPSYHYAYNSSVSFEQRIDGVINWLKLPESERPHLIMWYIQEPDSKGHDFGPDHQETVNMVEYLDSLVGVFYNKINELPFADQINVIITSDHGMGEISNDRVVYLFDLIEKEWCEQIDGDNPVYSIEAKNEFYDTIYKKISKVDHITIWKKNEIPERLHYGSSERVKDFVILADSSWSILKSSKKKTYLGGTHGYDNQNSDMHAIFYAYGPAFKEGYKNDAINNIDIYPLICKIFKIIPAKVDGKIENTSKMLKE